MGRSKAEPASHVDYFGYASNMGKPYRNGVVGVDKSLEQRHLSLELPGVIAGFPDIPLTPLVDTVVVGDRGIQNVVYRPESLHKGSGVDKGLEGRPGLAKGLSGPVELCLFEVLPAHHGQNLARPGVKSNYGPFAPESLYGFFGRMLQVQVQGRVYPEPSPVDHVASVSRKEVLKEDVRDEVGCLVEHYCGFLQGLEVQVDLSGGLGLLRRDHSLLDHPPQNIGLSLRGPFRVPQRGVVLGSLDYPCEKGCLREVQFRWFLVEVEL